jgi:hypothetical protein
MRFLSDCRFVCFAELKGNPVTQGESKMSFAPEAMENGWTRMKGSVVMVLLLCVISSISACSGATPVPTTVRESATPAPSFTLVASAGLPTMSSSMAVPTRPNVSGTPTITEIPWWDLTPTSTSTPKPTITRTATPTRLAKSSCKPTKPQNGIFQVASWWGTMGLDLTWGTVTERETIGGGSMFCFELPEGHYKLRATVLDDPAITESLETEFDLARGETQLRMQICRNDCGNPKGLTTKCPCQGNAIDLGPPPGVEAPPPAQPVEPPPAQQPPVPQP